MFFAWSQEQKPYINRSNRFDLVLQLKTRWPVISVLSRSVSSHGQVFRLDAAHVPGRGCAASPPGCAGGAGTFG